MAKRLSIPKRRKPVDSADLIRVIDDGLANQDYSGVIARIERLAHNQKHSIDVARRWAAALDRSDQRDQAVETLEKARAHSSFASEDTAQQVSLCNDLARLLFQSSRFDESVSVLQQAIQLSPADAELQSNLVLVLEETEHFETALERVTESTERFPSNLKLWRQRAELEQKLERYDQAADSCERCIQLDPSHTSSHRRLVSIQRKRNDAAAVMFALDRWLQQEPENVVAKHLLAATRNEQVPDRPEPEYIKQVFNEFAETFDDQLHALGYVGPERLLNLIHGRLGEPAGSLMILDAGCGTGLLAERLRPYASTLIGIDLSESMLERARKRSYDGLECVDLVQYFRQQPAGFDVIASADTFNYLGELQSVMEAAFESLQPGGSLFFTVEKQSSESSNRGYQLNPSGRYSHHRDYVESSLMEAGFQEIECFEDTLRQEADHPVIAYYWSGTRPASNVG